MQALGTDLLLVCSNVHPATLDDDSRAAADLAEMAERAGHRACASGTRPSPGAVMSTDGVMPGASCRRRTTMRSG